MQDKLKEKVVVVMPAYNAGKTLEATYKDIPKNCVDKIILSDDASTDNTVKLAQTLGISVIKHQKNKGYGANQKTCYDKALADGADYVIMIHPDYQYDPRVIPCALKIIKLGICDFIMGSRIRTRAETLKGGMPVYKYISNRILTIIENIVLGQNLGDFHSGFRVYSRKILETVNYHHNSDDFVFDTQFLAQSVYAGFKIGDIPIPTRYFAEASSINFTQSLKYGLSTLCVMLKFLLQTFRLAKFKIFHKKIS